jgi:stress response protein SCP2
MACLSGRFAKELNHVNDAWRIRSVGHAYRDDLQQFVDAMA